jgi:hypothetical protein
MFKIYRLVFIIQIAKVFIIFDMFFFFLQDSIYYFSFSK